MNLIRFLAITLFIWILFAVVKGYMKRTLPARRPGQPERISTMVRCAQCGLHIPEAEALTRGGKSYCSIVHRDES